jgi:hypothetical protein
MASLAKNLVTGKIVVHPSNNLAYVVGAIGVTNMTIGRWNAVRCPSSIWVRPNTHVHPVWADWMLPNLLRSLKSLDHHRIPRLSGRLKEVQIAEAPLAHPVPDDAGSISREVELTG